MEIVLIYTVIFGGLLLVAGKKPFELAFGDIKLLTTSVGRREFIEENHHKHFILTVVGSVVLVWLASLIPALQIDRWPLWVAPIAGYMLGFGVNGYVESRRQMKGGKDKAGNWNVPFCYRDVRFGALGGLIGTVVAVALL